MTPENIDEFILGKSNNTKATNISDYFMEFNETLSVFHQHLFYYSDYVSIYNSVVEVFDKSQLHVVDGDNLVRYNCIHQTFGLYC